MFNLVTVSKGDDDKCQKCGYTSTLLEKFQQHDCYYYLIKEKGYVICEKCNYVLVSYDEVKEHPELYENENMF